MVSKSVMVVAAAVSVYSVATAQDWETELGKQVASWSGAIVAGIKCKLTLLTCFASSDVNSANPFPILSFAFLSK